MTEIGSQQSGIAEVNGAHLFYESAGEGPAVVLIHAGIADSHMWDGQFDAFAQHFRVIRYDAQGYGRSDMPAGPFAARDDLHSLLRFLGVDRAALIGLSMGSSTAIDFTLDHPAMVWALVPTRPLDAVDPAIREKVRQMQCDASTSTAGEPRSLDPPAIGRPTEFNRLVLDLLRSR